MKLEGVHHVTAITGDALLPGLVVVHRRGPGDVVNGARAADAAFVRAIVGVEAAAPLASHLPGVVALGIELECILEEAAAQLRVGRVGTDAVETLER